MVDTQQSNAQRYNAMLNSEKLVGTLLKVDASCLYKSIYQSAKNQGLLADVVTKLYGGRNPIVSEEIFVLELRKAMSDSVISGQELRPGGSLSFLPYLFRGRDKQLNMTDFVGANPGTLDWRLLEALDDALLEHPDDRLVEFWGKYARMLRYDDFWPSAFEFNWIGKRLGVSSEYSKPIKLMKLTVNWDRMVGPVGRRIPIVDTRTKTGEVARHRMQYAEAMVQEMAHNKPSLDRCILIVHYGYATIMPFPGNRFLRRDNISASFPGHFVESLFTFFQFPSQAQDGGRASRIRAAQTNKQTKPRAKASPRKASPKKITKPKKHTKTARLY